MSLVAYNPQQPRDPGGEDGGQWVEDHASGITEPKFGSLEDVEAANPDVMLDIEERDDGIILHAIFSMDQGQGFGSKALRDIGEYADAVGKDVYLTPEQGDEGLTTAQLRKWYARHGYKKAHTTMADYAFTQSHVRRAKRPLTASVATSLNERVSVGQLAADGLEERLRAKHEAALLALGRRVVGRYESLTSGLSAGISDPSNPQPLPQELVLPEDAKAVEARAQAQRRAIAAAMLAAILGETRDDIVRALVEQQAGRQAERILEGARDRTAKVMLESLLDGRSVPETSEALRDEFREFSRSQATMLARTDLIALSNGASTAAASLLGEEAAPPFKTWLATEDSRTRPDHEEADGQTVPLDGVFEVGGEGLAYPGDPAGSDGNCINCRCTVVYSDVAVAASAEAPSNVEEEEMIDSIVVNGKEFGPREPGFVVAGIGWDESKHPRESAGTRYGGRFRSVTYTNEGSRSTVNMLAEDVPAYTAKVAEEGGTDIVVDEAEFTRADARVLRSDPQDLVHRTLRPREAYDIGERWLQENGAPNEYRNIIQTVALVDDRYPGGYERFLRENGLHRDVTPMEGTHMGSNNQLVINASSAPLAPPDEWLQDPQLDAPTPLMVTPEGRVYGHLAEWGKCHTGINGTCVMAPRSRSNYQHFHTGGLMTASGETVRVGKITASPPGMRGGHANLSLDAAATVEHYDRSCAVAALVRAGEDRFGPWLAGVVKSDATPEQIAELRANPPSGDWRLKDGALDLVAALAVPVPGFPVAAVAASGEHQGEVTALVMGFEDEGPLALSACCGCEEESLEELVEAALLVGLSEREVRLRSLRAAG